MLRVKQGEQRAAWFAKIAFLTVGYEMSRSCRGLLFASKQFND